MDHISACCSGFVIEGIVSGARSVELGDVEGLRSGGLLDCGDSYFIATWVDEDLSYDGYTDERRYVYTLEGGGNLSKQLVYQRSGYDDDEELSTNEKKIEAGVRPILTLEAGVKISGGTGIESDPYILVY